MHTLQASTLLTDESGLYVLLLRFGMQLAGCQSTLEMSRLSFFVVTYHLLRKRYLFRSVSFCFLNFSPYHTAVLSHCLVRKVFALLPVTFPPEESTWKLSNFARIRKEFLLTSISSSGTPLVSGRMYQQKPASARLTPTKNMTMRHIHEDMERFPREIAHKCKTEQLGGRVGKSD